MHNRIGYWTLAAAGQLNFSWLVRIRFNLDINQLPPVEKHFELVVILANCEFPSFSVMFNGSEITYFGSGFVSLP
jgi:hypothetical protein